jgi:dihydroorotase-like cyclic amidohydrolase
MRKISFGTRSPEGSISQGIISSLMVTAQRQGKAPLKFFYTLFTENPATAQAALFRNPPNTS